MPSPPKTFIVEHLDPEIGPWSCLEYATIAKETHAAGAEFCLSSVPAELKVPELLKAAPGFVAEQRSVEEVYTESKSRVCLLDPSATQELCPRDGDDFDVFLFGGILGDDPPRDRTAELRRKGFTGRRLGPRQMTTDTAVRVTRMITLGKTPLDKIKYIDDPTIKVNKHESTEMPFRYVCNEEGRPIMPEGMLELIKKDTEKGFGDLL